MCIDEDDPPLLVKVTDFNRHEHISSVVRTTSCAEIEVTRVTSAPFSQKRQKGGIGSSAYDPKQQKIRDFFGGKAVKDPVEALERSESNAEDEVTLERN